MMTLPHDYKERALLPSSVLQEFDEQQDYVTKDGVKVRLYIRSVFNNSGGACDDVLNRACINLYGIPFAAVDRIWAKRTLNDGWWYLVDMDMV